MLVMNFFALGGAGNVALNCAALGAQVDLLAVIGDDFAGNKLIDLLAQQDAISASQIEPSAAVETICKTRVIARGQHVVRYDREMRSPDHDAIANKFLAYLRTRIDDIDVVVLSDYCKGLLSKDFIKEVISLVKNAGKFVIADAKPPNSFNYQGVDLITPNKAEALTMAGLEDLDAAGAKIGSELDCNVLMTRGAEGMTLFADEVAHFPTKAKEVYDIVGAGDTVAAGVAMALAVGADLRQAARIANHAAGIVVGKVGTASVMREELVSDLLDHE